MKKIFIIFTLMLGVTNAYAENEPAATSREYVDAGVAEKQPTVPAGGANVVMTYDSNATDGIGTKQVYDPSGSYAAQQDALVTAQTANAAVQMAINGEFVCHEYSNTDPTDCWLWKIKEPIAPSRNLFDVSKIRSWSAQNTTEKLINNGDGSITVTNSISNTGVSSVEKLSELAPALTVGNTYTLSFDTTGCQDFIYLGGSGTYSDFWNVNTSKVITQDMLDSRVHFYSCNWNRPQTATISNIQIEPGTVATPYQPYGQNTFLPQNVQ